MKKYLIILLSLVLSVSMFAFAACSDTPADDDPQTGNEQTGDDGQDGTQPDGDDENAGDDTTEAQPPHTAGDPDSDTLVVYFSWSSSQNTEHMAEYIAEATGGYLVEIVPEEPYVGSYNDVAYGRAQEEAEQNARPAVSQATYDLIDLQKYDTVLVGYPIWWHTAPMVIGTFLEHYDWTNKDIYPFSQSASMDEGQFAESEQFVRDCAENATVHNGLFVRPSATQAIDAYLAENGLLGETSETPEEPQEPVGEATQSLTYERYEEGYAVTGVGDETVVVIPSEYEGLPVVAIRRQYGTGAFARSAMTSVVIPDSITEIGNNSFYNCTQLTSVQIGSGSALASIGRNAFSGCRTLAEMYIPASATSIGDSAFNNCGSVNFTVADGNAAYRSENGHLIERATNTLLRAGQSGVIPEGVQIIADFAFSRSVSVTELYIPSSVTEIGNYIAANATLSAIYYAGTEEEWNAVQKGSLWDLDNEGVQIVFSDTADDETDVLVVYFSATGNTERVAGYIAETTGGDLFELVPVDPYTSDDLRWTDDDSRVVQEYENPVLRDIELVSTTVENWAEYDVVFIGYPIWWYDAAWPVNGFVEDNDFTGKTVYTFCTSSSSGLGNSTQNLAEMAGGSGTWLDGRRFSSGANEDTVASWIESLGL